MKMFIISWLGNSEIKEYRKEKHRQQIKWAQDNGLDVHICAMDYNEEDYESGPLYYNLEKSPPAKARNHLLEYFYSTDDDYCIIADNDAVFKNLSDFDFLEKFNSEAFIENNIGIFTPLNPIRMPFNKVYQERKTFYDNNFVFEKNTHTKGSLYFCLNFRKHSDTPLYFDSHFENYTENGIIPMEDVDFGFAGMRSGWGTFFSRNITLHELSPTKSTWAGKDSRHDMSGLEYIAKKYGFRTEIKDGKTRMYPSKSAFVKSLPTEISLSLQQNSIEEFFL
jgi:hypothetical protein